MYFFQKVFQKGGLPQDMSEHLLKEETKVVDLMVEKGLASSKSEARRLIQQGGVRLEGEQIKEIDASIQPGRAGVLQVGKRKFLKIVA